VGDGINVDVPRHIIDCVRTAPAARLAKYSQVILVDPH